MSAEAARRRAARKKNPFGKALPAPLRLPEGCTVRCPECLSRCVGMCGEGFCEFDHDHVFACDH